MCAAALVLGAPAVSAQVPPAQGQRPPQVPLEAPSPDAQRPLGPAEVQSLIDGFIVIQAQKALNLSDTQFPRFVTRLRTLQQLRQRNQRLHNQLIQEMARLTNPASPAIDEAQLRDKLKALDDLDQKSVADLRKAHEAIDQILDIRQQARFRVFLDQVERRMLDILSRARAQAGPRAGRGGRR
jgi:hypothetical protein